MPCNTISVYVVYSHTTENTDGYDSINILEPVALVYEHNAANSSYVLTADDTYNPNTLYVQATDYAPDDSTHSPITPY